MICQEDDDLSGVPRYWDTFLDTPPGELDLDTAQVTLVPVPYDGTASYRVGARHGPKAIITASRQLEDYDLELDRDISLVGIHTVPEIEPDVAGPEAMVRRVERVVDSVAAPGRIIGLLGGEHTVTVGAIRALKGLYSDLSVLYLDAHADLRREYMGTSWGHASVARRLHDLCSIVLVGVRSLSADERSFIDTEGLPVFFWPTSYDIGELSSKLIESLSGHVYVSIDLDVFDPSLMSAVGTPEPGGMNWEEVTCVLRSVSERCQVVGFDVTELNPGEGPEACAFTAAKLTYKLIGYATSHQIYSIG